MSSNRYDDVDSRKREFNGWHPGSSEDFRTRRSEPPFDQRTSFGRNDRSQNLSLYQIPKKRYHSEIDNFRRNADENRPSRSSSQNMEGCFKRPDHRQHDQERHREPTTSSNSVTYRERGCYDPRATSVPLSSGRRSAPAYSGQKVTGEKQPEQLFQDRQTRPESSSSGGQNQPERSSYNSRNESERSLEANVNNEPESPPVQPKVASSGLWLTPLRGASLGPDAMNQAGSSVQGSRSTSQKVWTKEAEAALIALVKARPRLYDPNDPLYQDKTKTNYSSWRTIRDHLKLEGVPPMRIRDVWESLCRRYYDELARLADRHDPQLSEGFMQSMNFLSDTKELGPLIVSRRHNRPQVNTKTCTSQFLKLIDETLQQYSPAEQTRLKVNLMKVFADFGEPASEQRR